MNPVSAQEVHHARPEMLIAERIPFDLVCDQLAANGFIQSLELERIKVGYTDLADQSFLLQVQKGTSRLPCALFQF